MQFMNIAETIPLADSWGMHGGDVGVGWMIVMVLFWAAVVLGIVWLIRGSSRGWSAPWERLVIRESPVEILERRFAEGAISVEDYRARREVLANGLAQPSDADIEVPQTAPKAEEGGHSGRR
jgi:putative membrane protein